MIAHLQRLIDEGIRNGVSEKSMADLWRSARSKTDRGPCHTG
jgi:hypothetical protein